MDELRPRDLGESRLWIIWTGTSWTEIGGGSEGAGHTVHGVVAPGPYLPCLISVMSVFCVHLVMYSSSSSSWIARSLQLSSCFVDRQAVQYVIAGSTARPLQYKSSPPPPPLLQLARQGRISVSEPYNETTTLAFVSQFLHGWRSFRNTDEEVQLQRGSASWLP